jgi:hypothetical protein
MADSVLFYPLFSESPLRGKEILVSEHSEAERTGGLETLGCEDQLGDRSTAADYNEMFASFDSAQ